MTKEKEDLLDAKAVAVYLGVSRKTVYRAVKAGRIELYGFRVQRLKRVLRFERLDEAFAWGQVWVYQLRLDLVGQAER